ncbi:hypothetical protein OROHE_014450 [Orobanche hederae]
MGQSILLCGLERPDPVSPWKTARTEQAVAEPLMNRLNLFISRRAHKGCHRDARWVWDILQTRSNLFVAQLKDDLLHLLEENNIVVISGETRCGKTIQFYHLSGLMC